MHFRLTSLLAAAFLLGSLCAASAGSAPQGQQKGPPPGGVDLRAACHNDDEKVCPGVLAAHQNIVACLKAHIDSVSETCREALKKMPQGGPPPQGGQGGGGQSGQQPPAPPSGTQQQ